jgi:hypothetical protein
MTTTTLLVLISLLLAYAGLGIMYGFSPSRVIPGFWASLRHMLAPPKDGGPDHHPPGK